MFSDADSRPARAGGDRVAGPLRDRILAAARRLCFAGGVEATSARKIAAEVGCSPGAIYLHFDSLEHVLHEIRLEGHALLGQYLRTPPADLDGTERVCRMQREYHRFGCENASFFRLMFLSRIDAAALGEALLSEGNSLGVVIDAAALGVARGEIRGGLDPVVVANATWMSVHGLTSMVVSGHAAVTAPGRESDLLDAIVAGTEAWLRPPGAHPPA